MKTKEKISTDLINETLAGISEGIKPIIQNLDFDKLSEKGKENISQLLDELEAKALEIKRALNH